MVLSLYAKHPRFFLIILHLFFAGLAILGQVGENVSLPLWINTVASNCSVHKSPETHGEMGPFFVLSFASLSFVVVFGILTIINFLVHPKSFSKEDLAFPQWQFMLIGICDALNGVLVVYASPPSRTAPFLQAILGNITIPLTIVFRLLILRKKPTILKVIAAASVVIGLVVSLIPIIAGMDKQSKEGTKAYLDQTTLSRILWPLCFMIGFVPATLMNVFEEMSLKDSRKVNMFYLLFWTSLYQLITVWCFFWVDILPYYGTSPDIHTFADNFVFSFKCFFGGATCDYVPGLRGSVFVIMYLLAYIGSGLLLRYAEGATYLAIVQALVTPLGALFWSIFAANGCGDFVWGPHADNLTYFSIGGIVVIVPAILIYNIGTIENLKKVLTCRKSSPTLIDLDNEKEPLLAN